MITVAADSRREADEALDADAMIWLDVRQNLY